MPYDPLLEGVGTQPEQLIDPPPTEGNYFAYQGAVHTSTGQYIGLVSEMSTEINQWVQQGIMSGQLPSTYGQVIQEGDWQGWSFDPNTGAYIPPANYQFDPTTIAWQQELNIPSVNTIPGLQTNPPIDFSPDSITSGNILGNDFSQGSAIDTQTLLLLILLMRGFS